MPKGVYKRLRGSTGSTHPTRILEGRAVQTSAQTWAHLLCGDCEQRFNRLGEKWVLTHGLQQNQVTFPLLAKLLTMEPTEFDEGLDAWLLRPGKQEWFEPDALAYFAVSMIWRASVSDWGQPTVYPLKLGPYREDLRRFLLGDTAFPTRAYLSVCVRTPGPVSSLTYLPETMRQDGVTSHQFLIPGFFFILWLGGNLPEHLADGCLVAGKGHPMFVGSYLEDTFGRRVHKLRHQQPPDRSRRRTR